MILNSAKTCVDDVKTALRETLVGTHLGRKLDERVKSWPEVAGSGWQYELGAWFEKLAVWTEELCNDDRHGQDFRELINGVPKCLEPGKPARADYDRLVDLLARGYEALARSAPRDAVTLRQAQSGTERSVYAEGERVPADDMGMPIAMFAADSIREIETKLREPLRTLDVFPFRLACEHPANPLLACMEYVLSRERDRLAENMIRVGTDRGEPDLYSTLQPKCPGSEWAATAAAFRTDVTALPFIGDWTWLGVNALAYGREGSCILDALPAQIRNDLKCLLLNHNIAMEARYHLGVVEQATAYLYSILPRVPERPPSSRIQIDDYMVLCDGKDMHIGAEMSREVLQALLAEEGKVVTHDKLSPDFKSDPIKTGERIRGAIHDLRQKLPPFGMRIDTIPRVGYQLAVH